MIDPSIPSGTPAPCTPRTMRYWWKHLIWCHSRVRTRFPLAERTGAGAPCAGRGRAGAGRAAGARSGGSGRVAAAAAARGPVGVEGGAAVVVAGWWEVWAGAAEEGRLVLMASLEGGGALWLVWWGV